MNNGGEYAMAAKPWAKWYFADWRGDPRLRMCGLAARGLWADLLSYMHEGEPYGHLTIDGRMPDVPNIARLVGAPVKHVMACIHELESQGVFSRNDAGVIYSRRMVRDKEVSDLGREHIEKRWSPNRPPNRGATVAPITKSQKPEARIREEEKREPNGSPKKAIRWSDEMVVLPEWREAGAQARFARGLPGIDIELEADKFGHWAINADPKKDWRRAFINWCLNAKGMSHGNGAQGQPGALARIAEKIRVAREAEDLLEA